MGSMSSSSSSSASSFGLRTPEFNGAIGAPQLANLDIDLNSPLSIDSLSLHDPNSKGKGTDTTLRSEPPLELPAPPPLLLPRAFLLPRPAPPPPTRTVSSSSTSTSSQLDSDGPSTTPKAHSARDLRAEAAAAVAAMRAARPAEPLHLLQTSSPALTPSHVYLPPALPLTAPPPKPARRKRGRSVSVHLLWRSSVDADSMRVLSDFYEWKVGESWPDLRPECMESWSAKVEAAGL